MESILDKECYYMGEEGATRRLWKVCQLLKILLLLHLVIVNQEDN